MRRAVDLRAITTRARAANVVLPERFAAFVDVATGIPLEDCFFHIRGDARARWGLTGTAARPFVPFLRMGDGGWVSLWNTEGLGVAVVHHDSEGGAQVVAADFDDFLARLARKKTRVPELDEARTPPVVKTSRRMLRSLATYEQAFTAAMGGGSAAAAPETSRDAEALRKRAQKLGAQLVRDGLQFATSPRDYWQLKLQVIRNRRGVRVELLDYGTWKVLPPAYGADELVTALVARCKHPDHPSYTFVITKDGLVSFDEDKELVLLPPGFRTRA